MGVDEAEDVAEAETGALAAIRPADAACVGYSSRTRTLVMP